MPSFANYQKSFGGARNHGEAKKIQSDMVMEATWEEDIATRTCYFYDWYHDDNHRVLNDLHPENDPKKIPMRVKFLVNSSQTFDKDKVTYRLQMKPSQKNVVPYYDEYFKNRYGAEYPCGLYVDIPDKDGIFNRWLVVATANNNDPQFATYELLRCDKVLQFIILDREKKPTMYNVPVVLQSQNS